MRQSSTRKANPKAPTAIIPSAKCIGVTPLSTPSFCPATTANIASIATAIKKLRTIWHLRQRGMADFLLGVAMFLLSNVGQS